MTPRIPGPKVTLPGQLDLPATDCMFPDCLIRGDWLGLACEHSCPHESDMKRRRLLERRPQPAQKPMDIGLFSDVSKQVDLEDLL